MSLVIIYHGELGGGEEQGGSGGRRKGHTFILTKKKGGEGGREDVIAAIPQILEAENKQEGIKEKKESDYLHLFKKSGKRKRGGLFLHFRGKERS